MKIAGDIREKIMVLLADPDSRQIIASVLRQKGTVIAIGKEVTLPPSTLYRKISQLKECGLLMIDSFSIRPDGKREACYACTFTEIVFTTKNGEIELELIPSARSLEKRWFDLFFSRQTDSSSPGQP